MKINKNLLMVILVFFIGYFFINFNVGNKDVINKSIKIEDAKLTKTNEKPFIGKITKSLFVPYWSLETNSNLNIYDRVIYFGISTNESGINKEEVGYKSLEKFSSLNFINSKKYLTLRMINTEENLKILKNINSMNQIIKQTITIAKQNSFSGIVLDLEMSVLFGDDITSQINEFSDSFYKEVKENNLNYSIALYGDVFYRKRPYDVSNLAKNSDEIMIMAYDFNKSIGEPGPNFPSEYFDEFINKIPSNKLTVIFGMYGYDWIVGDKDRPIKPAQSLSLNEIRNKHLNDCTGEKCEFIDSDNRKHIIWYENEESVSKKIEYLKSRGVGSFAYWAAGYF